MYTLINLFLVGISVVTVVFLLTRSPDSLREYAEGVLDGASLRKEQQLVGSFHMYNPRVKEIQEVLDDAGFDVGFPDGKMGAKTRAALKDFQRQNMLEATGRIDDQTLSAISRAQEGVPGKERRQTAAAKPVDPAQVTKAQEVLKAQGFYQGQVDGKMGPKTKKALKEFQLSRNLKPDGIIGKKTWQEILAADVPVETVAVEEAPQDILQGEL